MCTSKWANYKIVYSIRATFYYINNNSLSPLCLWIKRWNCELLFIVGNEGEVKMSYDKRSKNKQQLLILQRRPRIEWWLDDQHKAMTRLPVSQWMILWWSHSFMSFPLILEETIRIYLLVQWSVWIKKTKSFLDRFAPNELAQSKH